MDSPDPTACGFPSFGGARCCLNAIYNPQYEWNDFQSGEKKKIANEQLWADAQAQRLNYYKGKSIANNSFKTIQNFRQNKIPSYPNSIFLN